MPKRPDGKLAATQVGNLIKIWQTSNGHEKLSFTGHPKNIWMLAFSADGQLAATTAEDLTILVWETGTGKIRRRQQLRSQEQMDLANVQIRAAERELQRAQSAREQEPERADEHERAVHLRGAEHLPVPVHEVAQAGPGRDELDRDDRHQGQAEADAGKRTDLYQMMLRELTEQIQYMDGHGYYGTGFTEHHFHIEGEEVSTNPVILDLYFGLKTKHMKFGQLGNVLPSQNPINLAENIAMVSQMLKGRVFAGFARGYQPRWVNVLGQQVGLADPPGGEDYEELKRSLLYNPKTPLGMAMKILVPLKMVPDKDAMLIASR